jgi:hypothetical protein
MRLALNTGVGWIQPNSYDYRSGTKHTLLLAAARLFRETPIKYRSKTQTTERTGGTEDYRDLHRPATLCVSISSRARWKIF